jgi:small subunit ribosomal protein S5
VARGRSNDREAGSQNETVVKIYRCSTVVKGGRRFSFAALVVVGDRAGHVGWGYGKANEVPLAVEKAMKEARKSLKPVTLAGNSIPHKIIGRFGASSIILLPAREGTGVIAGASARAVLELAGVENVLTKIQGSTSPKNVVKATLNGLMNLRSPLQVQELRGVALDT